MLYELGKYSGFVTIVLSWFTLMLPFLLLRKKLRINLISKVVEKSPWGYVTKLGVLACGLAQLLFSYFLYQNFETPMARAGIVLYGIGSLSFFLCGLINYYSNTAVHRFLVKTYYFWMTIGFVMLSLELYLSAKILVLLMIIFPLYFFLIRKNEITAEFLVIIISNLFALSVYRSLGVI
jgi:hypothetical membrane protein